MKLKISEDFSLPLELATGSIALLAMKGSGKTYTSAVLTEELIERNVPVVMLDPTGVHWGLKSSADGKGEGLQVTIFGGEHADLPLEEGAGEVLARAIVEKRFSCILDLSQFRKAQLYRFLTPFLETFYRLNKQPIHLVCDEADAYAPQKSYPDVARCLGAMEDIVRRGRAKGIGSTLITQRPASINKDVLTQCDCLMALRISHPRDIAPVMEWIQLNASVSDAKAMLDTLPTLPTGTTWIWAPSFGIFEKVRIRRRHTWDSSATPKIGQIRSLPKVVSKVDLEALGKEIAETIEQAKAHDPRHLLSRISKLQGEVAKAESALSLQKAMFERQKPVEIRTITDQDVAIVKNLCASLDSLARQCKSTESALMTRLDVPKAILGLKEAARGGAPYVEKMRRDLGATAVSVGQLTSGAANGLSKCERSVLTALVQLGAATKARVAIVSGYSLTSSSFANALSSLRVNGLISSSGDSLHATSLGAQTLGAYQPMPTGPDLLKYWHDRLDKAERTILGAIAESFPSGISRTDIAERSGYSETSSSFANALSKLRTLELITRDANPVASESFFH